MVEKYPFLVMLKEVELGGTVTNDPLFLGGGLENSRTLHKYYPTGI